MAKGRSGANRGWRGKMKKYLAENPEVQAKANQRLAVRLTNAKSELVATSEAISAEISRLDDEIANVGSPVEAAS